MTRVKICGITAAGQGLAAAAAGADFIGLVFASSRRQVTMAKALEIISAVSRTKNAPESAGIFVNLPASQVNEIADKCRLDRVQLSGDESWEYCRQIKRPIIKVLHISPQDTSEMVIRQIENGYRLLSPERLVCLLDTQIGSAYGGSGQTFDWELARHVAREFPVMIAGGLTPENVGYLIEKVHPWGVDVSSGVETQGKKDIQKIKDFIRGVKTCW